MKKRSLIFIMTLVFLLVSRIALEKHSLITIEGTIRDPGGGPMGGVELYVNGFYDTSTAADGTYLIYAPIPDGVVEPRFYQTDFEPPSRTYHDFSKKLLKVTKEYGKEAQVWIRNFSVQKNNEESVAEATYAAYNEGIRNIFAWAYRGTSTMSAFRSDNPDKVWKIQTDAFAECHDKAIMNEMIDTMRSTKR